MGAITRIAWCDATFNPWVGCLRVSTACDRCYAAALSWRYGWRDGKGRDLWDVRADRKLFIRHSRCDSIVSSASSTRSALLMNSRSAKPTWRRASLRASSWLIACLASTSVSTASGR